MQQYIGMRLGAYQIIEQIGQGGMATVFKAYQPSMDRYVAIKILPSRFTKDASFVGRFNQEARTLARLEHAHILPVHDYGEQEGITYLVMRYVKAGTLKDLIRQKGPIEPQEAARIMGQVGGALDYAHSQGVIHRDIKPSNVLIDQRGNTFLTDFGIAKLVAESAQFTATGAIIGTPAYMSPEQGMGQPADHRSDIYALGVVLYEMVTGRVPFEAETPLAVLLKHVNDPFPPPHQINPDLPINVERVILKAMAKSPDDRFQNAQALVNALSHSVAATLGQTATRPGGPVDPTTLVRGQRAAQAPAVAATPPPQAREATPPPPTAGTAQAPPVARTPPPRARPAAKARTRKPWILVGGAVIVLCLCMVAGVFVVQNLIDGEATPTPVSQVEVTSTTPSQAQETPTSGSLAQETPTTASRLQATLTVGGQAATTPSPAEPESVQYSPGWTNYGNSNFVSALARQGDTLWVGSTSGLVRWDLTGGSYERLGAEDGLASSYINDLLVDDQGALWIASDAGINRYDGQTMTTYDETDGLDSNHIRTLFQDDMGRLLAGSYGGERGLSYFDGQGWGPPLAPPLPIEYPYVEALAGSEEIGHFVGLDGDGLAMFDGEEWYAQTDEDNLPSYYVLDLLLTDDSLWVSFDQGLVWIDLETAESETLPHNYIYAMHQASNGDLWFGGPWHALRYDPYTGDWQEFTTAPGPIPDRYVTDITEGEEGLWFGTHGGGVAFYDGTNWETWATDDELGGNRIEAIRQGKDGAIWFAHEGAGVSRYEPQGDAWQVFGEAEGALDWPSVPGMDSDGDLWIAEDDELLYYDGQGWQTVTAPELAGVEIWGIEIGPNDVKWLVTDSGLMRHDPASDEWQVFTGADHTIIDDIWSIHAASDGSLWLGAEEGLVRYDGGTWSTPEAWGDPPEYVYDITEAIDGSLWVAADGDLGHLADGRWSTNAWPSDGWLDTLATGPDGSIWAGGDDGLGHFDPASGDWQMFTTADGLVHSRVQAIHVTPEGVVWVGTDGGVSRHVPPD